VKRTLPGSSSRKITRLERGSRITVEQAMTNERTLFAEYDRVHDAPGHERKDSSNTDAAYEESHHGGAMQLESAGAKSEQR
jgi:hypothetical protein